MGGEVTRYFSERMFRASRPPQDPEGEEGGSALKVENCVEEEDVDWSETFPWRRRCPGVLLAILVIRKGNFGGVEGKSW